MKLQRAFQDQVRLRKRVGVAERPKANVFRRPWTNAFGFEQSFPKGCGILSLPERNISAQHAATEISNRLFSCHGCLDFG